jgi:hypothetical protein
VSAPWQNARVFMFKVAGLVKVSQCRQTICKLQNFIAGNCSFLEFQAFKLLKQNIFWLYDMNL